MKAVSGDSTGGNPVAATPADERQATIADVARGAGVSEATVSRALRGLPHVRTEVRNRVREVASQLRYVADPNASRLASGQTRTIGLVAPQLGTWYVNQVSAGLEDVLQPAERDLLISSLSTPDRRLDVLAGSSNLKQRVDGLVFVDAFVGATWQRAKGPRPTVFVGERVEGEHSLGIDDGLGAALATKHLLSLGHRRVGIVGSATARAHFSPVSKMRLTSCRKVLNDAGLQPTTELQGDYSIESGQVAGLAIAHMAPEDRPTAVFCLSDEMAFGILQTAREFGINVPGDLSVVGFDDHSVSEAFGLTTVHQPVRTIGQRAAERVLELIDNGGGKPVHETLPVELIVRGTTAPPAH